MRSRFSIFGLMQALAVTVLLAAIAATGAQRVIVTHGYEAVMVRWLIEQGLQASAFATEYGGQDDEAESTPAAASE